MASERITLTVAGPDGARNVSLSSPNRVIWPELGITKRELAEYIAAVAEPFLRANGHRLCRPLRRARLDAPDDRRA